MSAQKYIDINRLSDFGEGAIVPLRKSIAPTEKSPAAAAHAVDSYIMYGGELYKVTSAISVGDTLTVGTNIVKTNVVSEMGSGGGSSSPYVYMTAAEYAQITPVANQLYWVINPAGTHSVYLNGSVVDV